MSKMVYWIFGRGASISCNLTWDMLEMSGLSRSEKITRICSSLKKAQTDPKLDVGFYHRLIDSLEIGTDDNWKHTFSTLNWDTLFERAIAERNWSALPKWLTSSLVYHWNGSIETEGTNTFVSPGLLLRSPMILPDDPPKSRKTRSVEGNYAFNKMGWTKALIICGVSFGNKCDDTLIHLVKWIHDELPIGECHCIVVNRSKDALERTAQYLQKYLWRKVKCVESGIEDWIKNGCAELFDMGAIKERDKG